ncbi:hypothetical protein [Candidatus Cetobacterium colombiensis]|uniref:Nucleotide exchange factor GrpE n=1 Tax=Candidatus Cetobacterium colombiensis TaxID=3073100 RepID=A0ABU4WCJ8_9FUSO|nr:hypothetical protein [Candidatus Cetobacterium colombiensis]MDX8337241.1 hypothetical protein [Candidatus Cetobacterium colombiensis]
MKKYLEKVVQNLKMLEPKFIYGNQIDNAFIENSLKKVDKSPNGIKERELFNIFGEDVLKVNVLKFARIFKMDTPRFREEIKNEKDELVEKFIESASNKEIVLTDLLKGRQLYYVTYKAFLIEIGNRKLDLKESITKIVENKDIKGCKKIVEDMFKFQDMERLKENTRELEESFEGEELVQFFKKLNSRKTDYLLDRLAFLVKELESDESKEKEMFLLKNLFKFFRNVGLSPIKKYGDNFEVTLKEIEDGEYIGEPFKDLESKEVNLERLGWRYGKVQISPIVYKEIK